jgi:hypothetical protein
MVKCGLSGNVFRVKIAAFGSSDRVIGNTVIYTKLARNSKLTSQQYVQKSWFNFVAS